VIFPKVSIFSLNKTSVMGMDYSIKVKNYKCFVEPEQGFDKLCLFNVIIGKNNSGKSSLIDLIEFSLNPKMAPLISARQSPKCIVEAEISEDAIEKVIDAYNQAQQAKNRAGWEKAIKQHVTDQKIHQVAFCLGVTGQIEYLNPDINFGQYKDAFTQIFKALFLGKTFKRINAERDILPETFYSKSVLGKDGSGATILIWRYLKLKDFDQDVIKKQFLTELNKIIKPDIEFVDIIVKEIESVSDGVNSKGEIQLENTQGGWVYLSKMGSGIKTIILLLLNLIVVPEIEGLDRGKYVWGFEELENNLHPSLQRRMFNYLLEYSQKHKCTFFLTTHSNIVIDLFSSKKDAQIIHVQKNGQFSTATSVLTQYSGRNILRDLDYKPSDLLLSNGIIWVEGPSDVVYIELFLELYVNKAGKERKLNYCIQSLATALWKYAGFSDFEWDKINEKLDNRIVSLAKINHNNLLVIDKDDNYEDKKPSEYDTFKNGNGKNKARLINEFFKHARLGEDLLHNNFGDAKDGTLLFWINDGTIESYLEYFMVNSGSQFKDFFETGSRGYFEKKKAGDSQSISKVELAAQIATFVLEKSISFDDLAPVDSALARKIRALYKTIETWN
jgi:putative ATP-dependent endonuclease of OLD family